MTGHNSFQQAAAAETKRDSGGNSEQEETESFSPSTSPTDEVFREARKHPRSAVAWHPVQKVAWKGMCGVSDREYYMAV